MWWAVLKCFRIWEEGRTRDYGRQNWYLVSISNLPNHKKQAATCCTQVMVVKHTAARSFFPSFKISPFCSINTCRPMNTQLRFWAYKEWSKSRRTQWPLIWSHLTKTQSVHYTSRDNNIWSNTQSIWKWAIIFLDNVYTTTGWYTLIRPTGLNQGCLKQIQ